MIETKPHFLPTQVGSSIAYDLGKKVKGKGWDAARAQEFAEGYISEADEQAFLRGYNEPV